MQATSREANGRRTTAMEPSARATSTGLGFEMAAGHPSHGGSPCLTTIVGPQLEPPSTLRFNTSAWSPSSPQLVARRSAKASSVPREVWIIDGMR